MKKQLLQLLTLCLFTQILSAQIGGNHVFEFVNLPSSARITGLGGNLITVRDDDVALAFHNPAATNSTMHGALSFNHNFFFSDISHSYFGYGHHVDKWKTSLHAGIQYMDYGTFDQTDITGAVNGTFDAAEYAVTIGAGRDLYENLSIGANLKFVSSGLETYNSSGILGDLSAMYRDSSGRTTITLLAKNIGSQLSPYHSEGSIEDVPFEMQLGFSKRLKHLPFRMSIIYHHLDRWNILFDDPNAEDPSFIIGEDQPTDESFPWVDNLARHFIFNGEFLFGKKEIIRLRLGYNHLRQREMRIRNFRTFAGFSFGFGLKIKQFRLDLGQSNWHLAGGVTHLTISTNLREFKRG